MSREILLPDAVAAQHHVDRARHRPRRNWGRLGRRYCIACESHWEGRGCPARREADAYFRAYGEDHPATATPITPGCYARPVEVGTFAATVPSEPTGTGRKLVVA